VTLNDLAKYSMTRSIARSLSATAELLVWDQLSYPRSQQNTLATASHETVVGVNGEKTVIFDG